MFGQRLNVLMIICWLTGQINLVSACSVGIQENASQKIMIIGENLKDEDFNVSTCSALNVICPSTQEKLIGNFCVMNINATNTSIGECKTTIKTYQFNISKTGNGYEVHMNEMVKGIRMWFLQNTSKCLASEFVNATGSKSTSTYTTIQTSHSQTRASTNPTITLTTENPTSTSIIPTTTITTDNPSSTSTIPTTTITTENHTSTSIIATTTITTENPTSTSIIPTTTITTDNTSSTSIIPTTTITTENSTSTSIIPTATITTDNPSSTSIIPTTTIKTDNLTSTFIYPTATITTDNPTSTSINPPTDTSTGLLKGCLNILNVDPEQNCTNATNNYDKCNGKEGTLYILLFEGDKWICVTCIGASTTATTIYSKNNEVKQPEMYINITAPPKNADGSIDPSKASTALDNMKSLVDNMKSSNKCNAAITMGDVIGVLQVQDDNTKGKDINICYSPEENLINTVETSDNAGFPWSVKVPEEAFNKSGLKNNGSGFVGILRYTNMAPKNKVLNNEVYGITMGANISNLTNNIEMTIQLKNPVGNVSCTSWDGKGTLEWTMFGCETKIIDNKTIKCSCSHLTFFAVLMTPITNSSTVPDLESLTLISSIGCGISVFFLAIALFMHFLLRKAKSNQATKILINMFVALFLLNVSFLSNETVANTENKDACVFIALLMHYSMLATFTWFFIQALHMYLWLIRQNVTIKNYMRKIMVLGWGFSTPIVIAVVSVGGYKAVTLTSTSGKIARMCWITDQLIHYIVNTGFYILVFVFTITIFIIIVAKIFQFRQIRATDGKKQTFRKQLKIVLSLFVLFGLTWAVAFFSHGPMLLPSYYIFSVLNSLQGFFLFLYYYHIHNDVAGNFSDDPETSSVSTTIVKFNNSVENVDN